MYTAILMSWSGNSPDPSRRGFATEEDAWEYVFRYNCDSCRQDIGGPYAETVADTACSAEWEVCPDDPEETEDIKYIEK